MLRTAAFAAALLAACAPAEAPRTERAAAAPPPGAPPVPAIPPTDSAAGRRVVYVPVYSHIYHRDQHRFIDLAVTLSVRNTDPAHPLELRAVHYYDTEGRRVRGYPARRMGPLATAEFVVEDRDREGGSGANFLVELHAPPGATEPVVEAVMVGGSGPLSVSFVSVGRELRRP